MAEETRRVVLTIVATLVPACLAFIAMGQNMDQGPWRDRVIALAAVGFVVLLAVLVVLLRLTWRGAKPCLAVTRVEPIMKANDEHVSLISVSYENEGAGSKYSFEIEEIGGNVATVDPTDFVDVGADLYWQRHPGVRVPFVRLRERGGCIVAEIEPRVESSAFEARLKSPDGEEYDRVYRPRDDELIFCVAFRSAEAAYDKRLRIRCWQNNTGGIEAELVE